MKLTSLPNYLLLFTIAFLFIEPAIAGPGGMIASAAFESFWGKVILGCLVVVFAPLLIWIHIREKVAEKRARKDLRFMAAYSSRFDWLHIHKRIKDCFYRVHRSWDSEDLSDVTEWMCDWYWQNQQLVHLDRWKKEGLQNICNVKLVKYIRPVLFVHRNIGEEHEDSVLVVTIKAEMQDYLQCRKTEKIVEGSYQFKDVYTVWTFTMVEGEWKVSDIEDGSLSLAYAKLKKDLPPIETTVVADLRA